MAGKISEMTAASAVTSDDLFEITNDPGGTPASQKATAAQVATFVLGSDAEVAAIAGLTSAADKVPYFTGSGTAALTDLTSTARSLLDDASTSAMRTTLGLAIGTDVQAYDADLAAIAALTPSQGDIIYHNGTAWTRLAAGTSGHFLKTNGAGANPAWATASGGGSSKFQPVSPLVANYLGYGIPGLLLPWSGVANYTNGWVYLVAFEVGEDEPYDAYDVGVNTANASEVMDVAVYSCTTWRAGVTASKVAGTEVTAQSIATTGTKTFTLGATKTLTAGRYMLGFVCYGGGANASLYSLALPNGYLGARVSSGSGAATTAFTQATGASSLAASYALSNAAGLTTVPVVMRGA